MCIDSKVAPEEHAEMRHRPQPVVERGGTLGLEC